MKSISLSHDKVSPEELTKSLAQHLRDSFNKSKDRIAITYEKQSITYQELDRRAASLCASLKKLGVASGDRIGLHLANNPETVIAILAIIYSDAAYVPLDPYLPEDRLGYIAENAGIRFIISGSSSQPAWTRAKLLDVTQLTDDPLDLDKEDFTTAPEQQVYVMYTSGSTGKPKGVVIHQKSLLNFLLSMKQRPGMSSDDHVLTITTPAFDISTLEIFLPLLVGARMIIANRDQVVDGSALADLITDQKATFMQATPSTWRILLMSGWQGSAQLKALSGGEMLGPQLAKELCAKTKSLWNMYGPTETTVWSSCGQVKAENLNSISAGIPIANTALYILDPEHKIVPVGTQGELYIGGYGVSYGYQDKSLNEGRFFEDGISEKDGFEQLYSTGDSASIDADGQLVIHGRLDDQVKIRGFRIELQEVEAHISKVPGITGVAALCVEVQEGIKRLVAFVSSQLSDQELGVKIRSELQSNVPDYMIPSEFYAIDQFPLNANGKIDRPRLKTQVKHEAQLARDESLLSDDPTEIMLALCRRYLGKSNIDTTQSIFDQGVDSLMANRIVASFSEKYGKKTSVASLFEHPSIEGFVKSVSTHGEAQSIFNKFRQRVLEQRKYWGGDEKDHQIAIIGMSGRFPGADTVDELWDNISRGKVTTTVFDADEDDPSVPQSWKKNPNYVRRRGMIKNPEMFDASFFGFTPHDTEVMDPQERVFLELAWHAMENAGYTSEEYEGLIGAFAGMGNNFYYHYNVSTHPRLIEMVGDVITEIGREKDHIATLVSHKMNLTGPSISLNTACSTALVSIDAAVQALLSRQCDMALAGGIELRTPQMSGQVHEPEGIFSHDGQCRPFSSDADGTLFSDSAGVLVLKRLSDAIKDRDTIHGVILGSAVNHDGLNKKSYLAPSVRGQMEVISMAHARAGVRGDSIGLVEAHGTGTPVGDPIEFSALRQVYEAVTDRKGYCALNSVKANLGHPTTAAGVVGVIKALLCFRAGTIPPQVNFNSINPNIDIESSPFFINTKPIPFPKPKGVMQASVSSFGFCGTNAHVVLQEPPVAAKSQEEPGGRPTHLMVLSAKTASALQKLTDDLADYISSHKDLDPYDICYTLARGRQHFNYRRAVIFQTLDEAAARLKSEDPQFFVSKRSPRKKAHLAFMFPGQGSQYVGMGGDLYKHEEVFKEAIDRCAGYLEEEMGEDIRTIMMPQENHSEAHQTLLQDTYYTQPAIFTLEYALAQLFLSWGYQPKVLLGHSIGEFVCATLSGVFSLRDAIKLIAARSRLMRELPRGGMLSVRSSVEKVEGLIPDSISLAAVNSPQLCVYAGPNEDIDKLQETLSASSIVSRRLYTSHAFHSTMMEGAVLPFLEVASSVKLSPPNLDIISTVTGQVMTAKEATNPEYWATHLRNTVRFADALATLYDRDEPYALLELGPRATLSSLAISQAKQRGKQFSVSALSDSAENNGEINAAIRAVGHLFSYGCKPNWKLFYKTVGRRIPLPSYPFERKRFWVEPATLRHEVNQASSNAASNVKGLHAVEELSSVAAGGATATTQEDLIVNLRGILEGTSGLDLSDVDASTTFFDMGLDSLILTQIAFKVEEEYGVRATFRQLLKELSTLKALAAFVKENSHKVSDDSQMDAAQQAVASEGPSSDEIKQCPSTEAQREIWISTKWSDEVSLAYLESATIFIKGELNFDYAKAAIQELVKRHDSLRSIFSDDGESLFIHPYSEITIPIHKCETPDQADTYLKEEMKKDFDLEEETLFRALIIERAKKDFWIVLTAHHTVCDGWSLDVLIDELSKIYSSLADNQSISVLPVANQFEAYARKLDSMQSEESYKKQEQYWLDLYKQVPRELNLPTDRPRPEYRIYDAEKTTLEIDPESLKLARELCSRLRISLFSALLTCLKLHLYRLTGQTDLVVAIPAAGQAVHNKLDLVGHCTNLLPIRSQLLEHQSVADYLANMQENVVLAYENQGYTYGSLVQNLKIKRDPARLPLLTVGLTHTKRLRDEDYKFKGLEADYTFNRRYYEVFDIYFNAVEYDHKVVLSSHFQKSIFDISTIQFHLEAIRQLFSAIVQDPKQSLGDLRKIA